MASQIPVGEGNLAQHIFTADGAGNKYYFEFIWSSLKFPVTHVKITPVDSINHVELLGAVLCPISNDPDHRVKHHLVLFCKVVGSNGHTSETFPVRIENRDYDELNKHIRCVVVTYGTKENPSGPYNCAKYNSGNPIAVGGVIVPDVDKDGNIIIGT
ncbi:MAG: hypothetical protein Aureis2KO_20870 [Aureisphaera sp.]